MAYLLFFLVFLILVLVIGWHIIFSILGGVFLIGATAWGIAIVSVMVFAIGILMLFLFTGVAGIVIGVLFAIWTIIAIILFPILFPLLLPLFIIYAFISFTRKCKKNSTIK